MTRFDRMGRIIFMYATIITIIMVSSFIGLIIGNHLYDKDNMESHIETPQECTCPNCNCLKTGHCNCADCHDEHDDCCEHGSCHCGVHESNNSASAQLAENTYYRNGNSFFTRTSRVVYGTPIYRCTVCGNQGQGLVCYHNLPVYCTNCNMSGYWRCTYCNGAGGGNSCSSCNGTGYCYRWVCEAGCEFLGDGCPCCDMWAGECDDWVYGTCPTCVGTGGRCGYCGGDGKQNCSTCGGSGRSYHWQCDECGGEFEDWETCPCCGMDPGECSSRVYGTCSSCNGTGNKFCWTCGGDGIVTYQYNVNCATQYVSTPSTTYYTYTNIDTGAVSAETTANYNLALKYYVRFYINNTNAVVTTGATSGSMSNQLMLMGHSEALTANAYNFDGHYFAGWATSPGTSANPSGVTYSNGQTINLNLAGDSGHTYLDLYGVWLYKVARPAHSSGDHHTFSNSNITHGVNNYNSGYMTMSGTTTAKNVGTYTITYTPKTGYCWSNNNQVTSHTLTWYIDKKSLTKPSLASNPTYAGGATVYPTLNYYDNNTMSQGGTTSATVVNTSGNYTLTISLRDTSNYQWSGGGTDAFNIYWNVNKLSLTIPTVSGSFTYDRGSHSATISNMNSTYINQGGTATATDANTYTVTFSLKDTNNTQWSGGSTAQQSGTWTISKKDLSGATVTLPQYDYTYDGSAKTPTPSQPITVTT